MKYEIKMEQTLPELQDNKCELTKQEKSIEFIKGQLYALINHTDNGNIEYGFLWKD